jgi:hypothetical protein
VNTIAAHLPRAYRLHEQQIKLLKRLGHAGQKSTFLPARRGSRPSGGASLSMVGLKKECPEELLKLLNGKVWFTSPFLAESIKFAKKHFVNGSEEALDAAAPLRLSWC